MEIRFLWTVLKVMMTFQSMCHPNDNDDDDDIDDDDDDDIDDDNDTMTAI